MQGPQGEAGIAGPPGIKGNDGPIGCIFEEPKKNPENISFLKICIFKIFFPLNMQTYCDGKTNRKNVSIIQNQTCFKNFEQVTSNSLFARLFSPYNSDGPSLRSNIDDV